MNVEVAVMDDVAGKRDFASLLL